MSVSNYSYAIIIGITIDVTAINDARLISESIYEVKLIYPRFKINGITYSGSLNTHLNTSDIEIDTDRLKEVHYHPTLYQFINDMIQDTGFLIGTVQKLDDDIFKLSDVLLLNFGNAQVYFPGRPDMYPEMH